MNKLQYKCNRQWQILMLLTCITSLSFILTVGLTKGNAALNKDAEQSFSVASQEQLHKQAEAITVKILAKEALGSGFLVKQQDSVYTVVTNAHVLRAGTPPYQVQTSDGQVYAAQLFEAVSFKERDLALLQFQSPRTTYQVASLGKLPKIREEVFAAGFPSSEALSPPSKSSSATNAANGFVFRIGKVSLILDKALKGGYQIGYTNRVEKGMSGGPVLNDRGEVVAINGMHAEPLWGSPYIFIDDSVPDPDLREQMYRYSWAIPIETFNRLASAALTTSNSRPKPYNDDKN